MPQAFTEKRFGNKVEVMAAAAIAAPVGVTSSPWRGPTLSGSPVAAAMFTTAGTGTGITPCWQRTIPVPSTTRGTMTLSTPRLSRQTAAATTSTMASIAPTSWKCTSSTGTPCALDSAWASRRKAFSERDRARGARSSDASTSRTCA